MLLRKALNQPQADVATTVYLTTWESNTAAQELYRRFGFAKAGEIPEYDEHGRLNGYEHILVKSLMA